MLVKEYLSHRKCYMRNGNLLKNCVNIEICVKRLRINKGVGVSLTEEAYSLNGLQTMKLG